MLHPHVETSAHAGVLLTRNAELIVALRHTIAALHEADSHPQGIAWTACSRVECRKVQDLLSERLLRERRHAAGRSA